MGDTKTRSRRPSIVWVLPLGVVGFLGLDVVARCDALRADIKQALANPENRSPR